MKPGNEPVALTSEEIIQLVESVGLHNGILKNKVIEEIKKISRKGKIKREVQVLIQLATHPCGQHNILSAESKYISEMNTKNNPNKESAIITAVHAIASEIYEGFDVGNKQIINIDWATGKITIKKDSGQSDVRWGICVDVPITMQGDTCPSSTFIPIKNGILTEAGADFIIRELKIFDKRHIDNFKRKSVNKLKIKFPWKEVEIFINSPCFKFDIYKKIETIFSEKFINVLKEYKNDPKNKDSIQNLDKEYKHDKKCEDLDDEELYVECDNERRRKQIEFLKEKYKDVVKIFESRLNSLEKEVYSSLSDDRKYGPNSIFSVIPKMLEMDESDFSLNIQNNIEQFGDNLIFAIKNLSMSIQEVYFTNGDYDTRYDGCTKNNPPFPDIFKIVEETNVKSYILKHTILSKLYLYKKLNENFDLTNKLIFENIKSVDFQNKIQVIDSLLLKFVEIHTSLPSSDEKNELSYFLSREISDEIVKSITTNTNIDENKVKSIIDNYINKANNFSNKPSAGKRKTPRRKVSKRKTLRGGKAFTGQQGCVTVPSLVYNCLTRSRNGMRVTKLFFKEEDYVKEKQENDIILQEVDPEGEFTSVKYDESPIDLTRLQQDEIATCGSGKNLDYSKLKHLNYKYLGDSFETILNENKFDKDSSKDMIQALANLAPKIQEMNLKGFYHNDLHFGNITYLPSEKRAYLIDFGFFGKQADTKPTDLIGFIEIMFMLVNTINNNTSIPQPMRTSASNFLTAARKVITQFKESPTYNKEIEDLIVKTINDFATEYTSL